MKLLEWKKLEQSYEGKRNKEIPSKIILMCIILVIIYYIIGNFINELKLLISDGGSLFYIQQSSARLLLIFSIFFWGYFFIGALQFVFNFSFAYSMKLAVWSGLIGFPLIALSIIPLNSYIETNLKAKGYSYCYWYTDPSFRAPNVWLKNERLCLQDGSIVISDLADFFKRHNQQGTEPTVDELEMFIKKMRQALDN